MKKRQVIAVPIWDNWIFFLKQRYGIRKSTKHCVEMAIAEIVRAETENCRKGVKNGNNKVAADRQG